MSKKKAIIVESCAECDYFGKCLYKIRTEELHACKREGTTHPDCPLPDYPEEINKIIDDILMFQINTRQQVTSLIANGFPMQTSEILNIISDNGIARLKEIKSLPSVADKNKGA